MSGAQSDKTSDHASRSEVEVRRGYQRLLERKPDLRQHVEKFEEWLQGVEQWLDWLERHVEDGLSITRKEALEDFHFTKQGLELLERLQLDVYAPHDGARVMYDPKKLLRAVVALPTIARLKGKKLHRQGHNITTIFKEVINDTLAGSINVDHISSWSAEAGEMTCEDEESSPQA